MTAFPHLFAPLALGAHTVPNRLFFPPHGTSLPERGQVGERMVAYHAARAAGGVGMIVIEGMSMHESFDVESGYVLAGRPGVVPGFARLADAVHAHGTKLLGQLFHPGAAMRTTHDGSRRPVFSASDVPFERYGLIPVPASRALLAELTEAYARAAGHMRQGGFDGVEILASMGYLIAQFLNPRTNRRQDDYGGNLENRMRFLVEVLAACRAAMGPGMILGVRISDGDPTPGAMESNEVLEVCRALEATGLVDYFSIIGGNTATTRGWIAVSPHMAVPQGHVAPQAGVLKAHLKTPVLVAGRVNQAQTAERVIAEGQADMVGMVRGLIADPLFPQKAREGRPDDIRACIACNQACVGHRLQYHVVSCIQHPETGRELEADHVKTRTDAPRRVAVIGGGPAGMKAAAVAAERGHDVTLYESSARLGGQALLAQALPGREEFGGIVTNLTREMELAGVRIKRNRTMSRSDIVGLGVDAVIVATGGLPRWPEMEGGEGSHIVDAWAVIRGEANVGGSVLIADWKNDWVGLGLAEKLARDGCRVRLAFTANAPGMNLVDGVRDHWVAALQKLGVAMIPYARLFGADGDTVYLQHTVTDDPIVCEEVETLVLSQGTVPDPGLAHALEDWQGEVHLIGDALSPRTCEEAVLEGLRAAMRL